MLLNQKFYVLKLKFLQYAGGLDNDSLILCPNGIETGEGTCTEQNVYYRTPAYVFSNCKCWHKCSGYAFVVSAYDKIHHASGKNCTYRVRYKSFDSVFLQYLQKYER